MIFQQNKKSAFLVLTIMLVQMLLMSGVSIGSINTAYAAFSCADVGNSKSTTAKGWIVTVLEEQIGTPAAGDATQTLNCFRKTTCATSQDTSGSNVTTCTNGTSEYVDSCQPSSDGSVLCDPVQVFFAQSGSGLLFSYVSRIYQWAAVTIGIVTVFFLVWGGIDISTAQGDSSKIEKAKERIMNSIAGLVVLFLSALILYTVNPNFFTK